ncbi:MAG TPA: pitrilysin family protein [Solirubrobacteraceae bacterium]|nr:pitrilysin family protein [Solirubrobacteraceae bacterium]
MRVATERLPGVRSVALGFWMDTGSTVERDEQAGISHLLEHMLFRGTERFGSEEIDQIFDALGAEINAGTDKEATSLYTRVLDGHVARAFEVMSDMVWEPRFGELEAEREVVLEEIAMYEDDPQDRVFDILSRAIFGTHPLGRPVIGSAEVVGNVTREALRAFHRERYLPERVVIAAAGSIEHERLVELAAAAVPERTAPADTAALETAPPPADSEQRVRFLEKETEQFHVCIGGLGITRHDERRFALRVLEGVLGGTTSSRLFQEVRERRGLAYSVFSFSNLFARSGEFGLYLGTRPENLPAAVEVVAAELARFLEDPASDAEIERSRENLKGRMMLGLESTGARMSRLGGSLLAGLPLLSLGELIERVDAVSVEDLRALAAELIAPERLSVVAVGPDAARFHDAIAPLLGGRETVIAKAAEASA